MEIMGVMKLPQPSALKRKRSREFRAQIPLLKELSSELCMKMKLRLKPESLRS
jgi:hypothetical protein